ncbi:MAG: 3-phosphoshikimate 1-carboxyvinyltransferase [Flavobacteriaceae bacterium]|nr:3-phosphoshikimate 1-carboxyvinyltransferase [Flavobacteriaceae bacterium]
MHLNLDYTKKKITNTNIKISGSKSESNRLLILQQWYANLRLENLSDSDDTRHLQQALATDSEVVNIGHAGTAMRFLTAYFSLKPESKVVLTGSERMQNRPIQILVDALQSLDADIEYVEKMGYPPLQINGKKLLKKSVSIQGNVSSQYISALLLIAPHLENGLEIELLGEITSRPYLEMTLSLLHQVGIKTQWHKNIIKVHQQQEIDDETIVIESDWSSASYFYSLIALSEIGAQITLSYYKKESLQGDSCLAEIYKAFGVETEFLNHSITLKKTKIVSRQGEKPIQLNLVSAPDIAQTIAVTCFGLGFACHLTGLHTLKIKETDRLVALKNELQKLGAILEITDESLHLEESLRINKDVSIETYNDHRMAMAFAPFALIVPITIKDADVVTKSYISFWEDLEACLQ